MSDVALPISEQDLRDFADLQLPQSSTLIDWAIKGAVSRCAEYTHRQLTPLPAPSGDPDAPTAHTVIRRSRVPRRLFAIPDARTVTEVIVDGTELAPETDDGWGSTGYILRGHPDEDLDPAPVIELPGYARVVKVTGTFGFDPLPDGLKESLLRLAGRAYHQAKALYGDTKELPEGGYVSYFKQLPVEVQMTWDDYEHELPIFVC